MGTEKQQAQVDVQIEVELEVPFTILHLISWEPTGGGGGHQTEYLFMQVQRIKNRSYKKTHSGGLL